MKWFIPIVILLLIPLHLIVINNSPLVGWDESVYIGMGKYLASGADSGLYEEIRPTGLPILTGLLSKADGDHLLFSRIAMLIVSIGVVVASMRVASRFTGSKVAYLGGLFLAITPLFFEYSTQVMSSMLSILLVLLSYLALEREHYKRCGLFMGLAVLTRFPSGMFLLLIIASLIYNKKSQKLPTVIGWAALAISPYFIINLILGYGLFAPIIQAFSHAGNQNFSQSLFYYFPILIKQSPLVLFIPFGIMFAIKRKYYLLLASALLPLLYFTLIANKQPRFLLLALPFLIMLGFFGLQWIILKTRKSYLVPRIATLVLLLAIFMSFSQIDFNKDDFSNYQPIILALENVTGPVIVTDPIPTSYTNIKAIPAYEDVAIAYTTHVEQRQEASHLLYTKRSFPCEVYPDQQRCQRILTWFEDLAQSNQSTVYNAGGFTYYLIKLENTQSNLI